MITKIKIKSSPKLDTSQGKNMQEMIKQTDNLQRIYQQVNKVLSYIKEYPDEPIEKLIRLATGYSPNVRTVKKTNKIYIFGHLRIYEQINGKKVRIKKIDTN